MVLGAIVLVYRSTPSLVWILWIALALMLIALGVFINKMSHLFEVQQGKMDAVNNVLQEDLSGIRVVKAFVQEQYETRRYDRANQEFRKASLKPVQYAAPAAADAVPGGEPGHRRRVLVRRVGQPGGGDHRRANFRLCPVPGHHPDSPGYPGQHSAPGDSGGSPQPSACLR